MTTFPVGIKTLISRKRYEMGEKLLQNTSIKSGSAYQKTHFSTSPMLLHAKVVMTSFPVYKNALYLWNFSLLPNSLCIFQWPLFIVALYTPVRFEVAMLKFNLPCPSTNISYYILRFPLFRATNLKINAYVIFDVSQSPFYFTGNIRQMRIN